MTKIDDNRTSSGPGPMATCRYVVAPQGRLPSPRSAQRPIYFIAEYGPDLRVAPPQQCPGLCPDSGPNVAAAPPPAVPEEKEEHPPQPTPPALTETTVQEKTKKYDREFLLKRRFVPASLIRPPGLPQINDVVLPKMQRMESRTESRMESRTESRMESRTESRTESRIQSRPESRMFTNSQPYNDNVQLNQAEKAWKPSASPPAYYSQLTKLQKREQERTKDLLKQVCSILNKLTPQKFEMLMARLKTLTIDTEERLKGVIGLIFEKAISEQAFSELYAKMCRVLSVIKVQSEEKPGSQVNFRTVLLKRCQTEFEKDKDSDEIFEKKQRELEAASGEAEKKRLRGELEESKDKARRRSLGNIKFVGELFKIKMLTEAIMHDCIMKLLQNKDDESLEVLCKLLSTIGKDLDVETENRGVDQCFKQMERIVKESKTSPRIRFMLLDVLDLRKSKWVPRREYQGPKTIDQIREEAKMEEQMEAQQVFYFQKETSRGSGGWKGKGGYLGRGSPPQNRGCNTEPMRENPPNPSHLMKIIKNPFPNVKYLPESRGMWHSGCKNGSRTTAPVSGLDPGNRPSTSTMRTSSDLSKQSRTSTETDRRVPQPSSSSHKHRVHPDPQNRPQVSKVQDREQCQPGVSSTTEARGKEVGAPRPPLPQLTTNKLGMEQLQKEAKAILTEYLSVNDMEEVGVCMDELDSPEMLFGFVRVGIDLTLDHSVIYRTKMGSLFHHLIKNRFLPAQQYYKGLQEVLEEAEDMAIDIPHIWRYLAELIAPTMREGGVPMVQLFSVISQHLVPLSKAGDLLVHILILLCEEKGQHAVGIMWREAGLQWKCFLPEDANEDDINKFLIEKSVEFTVDDGACSAEKHPDELLK